MGLYSMRNLADIRIVLLLCKHDSWQSDGTCP